PAATFGSFIVSFSLQDQVSVTSSTPVSALNGNSGIPMAGDAAELAIRVRDGRMFLVQLDGSETIGSLLSAISSQTSNAVTAALEDTDVLSPNPGRRIVLKDRTTGSFTFTVGPAQKSTIDGVSQGPLASDALGLSGPGVQVSADTISGVALRTVLPIDRTFVKAGSGISTGAAAACSDVDAVGRIGLATVAAQNGTASGSLSATLAVREPAGRNTGYVSLRELNLGLADIGSILDVGAAPMTQSLVLPIQMVPAVSGITLSNLAKATVSWSDPDIRSAATPATVSISYANMSPLSDITRLGLSDVSAAFTGLADFLDAASATGRFAEPVPGLNRSVASLVPYQSQARLLAQAVAAAGDSATLQEIIQLLSGIQGVAGVSASVSQGALRIGFSRTDSTSAAIPVDIPVAGGRLTGQGDSGRVSYSGGSSLSISMGIDIATGRAFLATPAKGSAQVLAANVSSDTKNISFSGLLGPLGVKVVSGVLTIDEDGSGAGTKPATFQLSVADADGDGRVYLSEASASSVIMASGLSSVSLPLTLM
ncbi:MAG: hypothetical protein ACKO26_02645, partial [Planctomycetota bacterium]